MPKFEELNNPNPVGEILKKEIAADAEKFPNAKRIISELEPKIDAIPPITPELAEEIKADAAAKAAKNAPTPAGDYFYQDGR